MTKRRNDGPDERDCQLRCLACERSADNFGHLHIGRLVDGEPTDPPELTALCVPCLAAMARSYEHVITAYMNGGIAFDEYANRLVRQRTRRRRGRAPGEATPLPSWALEVIQDIHRAMEQNDDTDGD